MISKNRHSYNLLFSDNNYSKIIKATEDAFQEKLGFRLLETPVFLPIDLVTQLKEASLSIVQQLRQSSFRKATHRAIPKNWNVPNEDEHPVFLQFDFALTLSENKEAKPQLIELQGFPALFFFQMAALNAYQSVMVQEGLTAYYDGLDASSYLALLRHNILGHRKPENTVLLEYDPWNQKTAIDFAGAHQLLGIPIVDIRAVKRKGNKLYYKNEKGQFVPIQRIFNRVILDELTQHDHKNWDFNLTQEVDVEWAGHPNWFLKYSKFSLPFIQGTFAPKSIFLDQWNGDKNWLQNGVLKPIYSFSGNGVHINPTKKIIDNITNKNQYILQQKVNYAPILASPKGGFSQVEVRVMLIQKPYQKGQYQFMTNLVRAGKGGVIGTQHQKSYDWTGGGIALMKK